VQGCPPDENDKKNHWPQRRADHRIPQKRTHVKGPVRGTSHMTKTTRKITGHSGVQIAEFRKNGRL
jgi:hypothetical protein